MNKQIEDMARIINLPCREILNRLPTDDIDCPFLYVCKECSVRNLYKAGYRKQADVATEIISDIEQAIMAHGTKYAMKRLAELKKKYEVYE